MCGSPSQAVIILVRRVSQGPDLHALPWLTAVCRQLSRYYHERLPHDFPYPVVPDWKGGDSPEQVDEEEEPQGHMHHEDVLGEGVSRQGGRGMRDAGDSGSPPHAARVLCCAAKARSVPCSLPGQRVSQRSCRCAVHLLLIWSHAAAQRCRGRGFQAEPAVQPSPHPLRRYLWLSTTRWSTL